jgi:hypothetical protein|tara:strand:- start:175 stop:963 length:789 start_codon:yes stop_codon:yes gene_type:complete
MKNIVVIPIIRNEKHEDKYGGFDWMEISKKSWQYWCDKNNCELVIYDTPSESDLFRFRVTWQRWFDVFDFLDKKDIEYDKVLMADACSIVKWDCPNFFDLVGENLTALRDMDNLGWIYESIQGYKSFFNEFELDITKYMNAGFVIFNKSHRKLFGDLKKFYYNNIDTLVKLQDQTVNKGTDQTPFNYWLQMNNIEVDELPIPYRLSHLHRRNMLKHNWQLNEDQTPFFIKYGYVWVFSGFSKEHRNGLMDQTWNIVKGNYES